MAEQREKIEDSAGRIFRDIAYSDRHEKNVLDIYLPRDVLRPPLMVLIHGGAFVGGDKAGRGGSGPTGSRALLRAGIAVASINYRLAPETTWPGQLDDLHDAFAFLRAGASKYRYDSTRMGTFGPSAGGHLAAMAAIGLALDPATRLKAAVLWYPPTDFANMDADMKAAGTPREAGSNAAAGSPESEFIGAPVGENAELAWLASPIAYLEELPPAVQLPSFLIMHGARDALIARGQSLRLFHALAARPNPPRVEYVLLPEGTHGGGEFRSERTRERVLDFLRFELAGR